MGDPASNVNFKSFLKNKISTSFSFDLIDECKVVKIIESLESKSSYGYDFISTKLIKHVKQVVAKPLTHIINQSITSGIYPAHLKIAKVIPIFKKGKDALVDNYRPISLLPASSKIFETNLHEQLLFYFSSNNLLYKSQYGFRPKYST